MICKITYTVMLMGAMVLTHVGCASTNTHTDDRDATPELSLADAVRALHVPAPTLDVPARFAASVAPTSSAVGSNATLIVKVSILPGWHIYADVPFGQPYAVTSLQIGSHPEAVQSVGDWQLPEAHPSLTSPDMLEYIGTAVFTHALAIDQENIADDDVITVTIGFQACDMTGCLPPQTITLRPVIHSD